MAPFTFLLKTKEAKKGEESSTEQILAAMLC